MDGVGLIINLLFFVLVIYLISRVAHFINHTKNKLNEIEKKVDDIKGFIANKD